MTASVHPIKPSKLTDEHFAELDRVRGVTPTVADALGVKPHPDGGYALWWPALSGGRVPVHIFTADGQPRSARGPAAPGLLVAQRGDGTFTKVYLVAGPEQTAVVASAAPPDVAVLGMLDVGIINRRTAERMTGWARGATVSLVHDPADADAALRVAEHLRAAGAEDVASVGVPDVHLFLARRPPVERTPSLRTLVDTSRVVASDDVDPALEREVTRERNRREARRRVDAEERPAAEMPEVATLTELLAAPPPPTPWRVEGWLPAGARGLLAAQAKLGKTHIALNLVRCLVDGLPFLGSAPVIPVDGSVVVLDFEMGRHQLTDWLRKLDITHTDRVQVYAMRGAAGAFNIMDPDVRREWAERLTGASVVVWDCLRPVADALGLDEHHDMGVLLVAFDELLAQAGVGEAVVLHHMGHSDERARGDSRLRDWPDVEWHLVGERTGKRYVSAHGRDVDMPETELTFDIDTGHMTTVAGSRATAKRDAAVQAVLDYVSSHPGSTTSAIEGAYDEMGQSRNAVRAARERLVEAGALRVEGRDTKGAAHRHYVPDTENSDAATDTRATRATPVPVTGGTGGVPPFSGGTPRTPSLAHPATGTGSGEGESETNEGGPVLPATPPNGQPAPTAHPSSLRELVTAQGMCWHCLQPDATCPEHSDTQ